MPHIHEKVDFTVEVFIVYKDKVLLRMHVKVKLWISIGGHIELDENPVEAAIREVKEEVGLDIKLIGDKEKDDARESNYHHLLAPKYLAVHEVNDKHQHVIMVYFATCNTDEIKDSKNEHEKAATCWVTKEELHSMNLRPNILFYATKALEELGGK